MKAASLVLARQPNLTLTLRFLLYLTPRLLLIYTLFITIMASNQKLYLVMPNWTTPPNTSIRLGDIILDPTNAAYSRVTRESEEFRHCKEGHDESGVLNPDLPSISTEIATPWIGYAEKYSSRSASADETHQENTKAGLQRFTCDELEMQVLNKPQDYIKKRAAAASVRKKMKPV